MWGLKNKLPQVTQGETTQHFLILLMLNLIFGWQQVLSEDFIYHYLFMRFEKLLVMYWHKIFISLYSWSRNSVQVLSFFQDRGLNLDGFKDVPQDIFTHRSSSWCWLGPQAGPSIWTSALGVVSSENLWPIS
jgi:hypothetical protein